jgi:hypothetical protein
LQKTGLGKWDASWDRRRPGGTLGGCIADSFGLMKPSSKLRNFLKGITSE